MFLWRNTADKHAYKKFSTSKIDVKHLMNIKKFEIVNRWHSLKSYKNLISQLTNFLEILNSRSLCVSLHHTKFG